MRQPIRRHRGSTAPFALSSLLLLVAGAGQEIAGQQDVPGYGPAEPIPSVLVDVNGDDIPDRLGDTVTVRGVALAGTGQLSAERLELAIDDGAGAVVLFSEGFSAPVHVGDTVVARGDVSWYHGQDEIHVIRYAVVGSGPPPSPLVIEDVPADIEALEGRLIRLSVIVGSIGSNSGGTFLSVTAEPDWGHPLLVYVRALAGDPALLARFQPGERLTVTGIVEQYDPEPPYDQGYEILPRTALDVRASLLSPRIVLRLIIGGAALLVLMTGWVGVLDRRVRRKTAEVQEQEAARHALEITLQERRRVETLGSLAGGIAHQFNNLLTTVIANAGLLAEGEGLSGDGRELVDGIVSSAHQAEVLTKQMLSFAGRSALGLEELALDELVAGEAPLIRGSVGERIRVETELRATGKVRADPAQIRGILSALVENAVDAMGDGPGTLKICTRPVDVSEAARFPLVGGDVLQPGAYAELGVRDEGPGLAPEVARRVFDLYFTTKSKGRGLGLPAALGVVRAQGGAMSFSSAPGAGTQVRVFLPVVSSGRARGGDTSDTRSAIVDP